MGIGDVRNMTVKYLEKNRKTGLYTYHLGIPKALKGLLKCGTSRERALGTADEDDTNLRRALVQGHFEHLKALAENRAVATP